MSWDQELTNYTIEDIDIDTLRSFYNKSVACGRLREEVFEPERLLIKLGLLVNDKLTKAGYLLFSKSKPIVLKMAVFATNEKLTFLDINRVNGNIFTLIEEANTYIKKNIRWKAEIVDFKSIETPEVPLDALREIICNSFAHARYNTMTEHEISIHPGFIRIYNPGEFPIGYKPEDFVEQNISSIVRNPVILKTLFLSEDVESYSSGFKRVFDACKKNNVKFSYENNREGFAFIFNRCDVNNIISNIENNQISKDENDVLNILKNNPTASAASLSKLVNKSERSVQRILKFLKDNGYIERIGTTRGYWEILK